MQTLLYLPVNCTYGLILIFQCPESLRSSVSRTEDYEDYNKSIDTPSEKSLAKLHRNVMYAMQTNTRHQTQWNMMLQQAFELEDRILNDISVDRQYKHSFPVLRPQLVTKVYTPQMGRYLFCNLHYMLYLVFLKTWH